MLTEVEILRLEAYLLVEDQAGRIGRGNCYNDDLSGCCTLGKAIRWVEGLKRFTGPERIASAWLGLRDDTYPERLNFHGIGVVNDEEGPKFAIPMVIARARAAQQLSE